MPDHLSNQNLGRVFIGFSLASLAIGCSVYPDLNSDPSKNNKVTFRRDALECAQAYPEAASGAYVKERIACMNIKGWHSPR